MLKLTNYNILKFKNIINQTSTNKVFLNSLILMNNSKYFSSNFFNKTNNKKKIIPDLSSKNNFTYSLQNKNFSIVEQIKLSNRIKLVDISEILEDSTEFAMEQLQFYLNKDNFKSFLEDFENYSQKGIFFNLDSLNTLMGLSYTKNFKTIQTLQEYIFDKNIRLDSLGYSYIILSTLKHKGFDKAYNLFIEASIFGIQQNLTIIVTLLSDIEKANKLEKNKCINFIFHHLQTFYSEDVVR